MGEIRFCDRCQGSIPEADLSTGRARCFGDKLYCVECLTRASRENTLRPRPNPIPQRSPAPLKRSLAIAAKLIKQGYEHAVHHLRQLRQERELDLAKLGKGIFALLLLGFIVTVLIWSRAPSPSVRPAYKEPAPRTPNPFYSSSWTQTPAESKPLAKDTDPSIGELEPAIEKLKEAGFLIRLNPQLNQAWVDSSLWQTVGYDDRVNLGYVLAHYVGRKKGTNLYWVDIFDARSGKKLAKYSKSWGFTVYE